MWLDRSWCLSTQEQECLSEWQQHLALLSVCAGDELQMLQVRLRAAQELTGYLRGCPCLLHRWWFHQSLLPDISGDQQTITEALFSSVLANVWLLLGNCEADLQQSPGWSLKFLTICHLPKEDFSEEICSALAIHHHSPDSSPSMSRRKLKQRGWVFNSVSKSQVAEN